MIRLQNLVAQGAGHLALCLLLVFFAASLSAGCLPAQMKSAASDGASRTAEEASEEFFAMDTKMTVKVYGEGAPEAARALTGAGKLKLDEAAGTARLEKGSGVELGAVAKGYAGELVAARLKALGVRSALLDLGGNIETVGTREDGTPWRVGLRNPFGGALLGTVAVTDAAVVTSAIDQRFFTDEVGRRYWHILDPATGAPAMSGLASATVVAASGGRADALSTALFVMGADRAAAFWRERQDFEMVLVGMDGHVWITEGLLDRFSAGEGLTGEAEVIR